MLPKCKTRALAAAASTPEMGELFLALLTYWAIDDKLRL
jgi:hypothetical protein